ncbi:hypothetical protein [Robbsia sp. KACC 23696]|uniref:hypothetical protein n=1 Tax=Robbsia sp. KACC 23696 TaxID=3149231 RepID=UPI00325AD22D
MTSSTTRVENTLRSMAQEGSAALTRRRLSLPSALVDNASAPSASDGRETPPPAYHHAMAFLVPIPASAASTWMPTPEQAAPGTQGRRIQDRRNMILAAAARRGHDLNELDPPPSYAHCIGEAGSVGETDAFAAFARGARALNGRGGDSDIEGLIARSRPESRACCLCSWLPFGIVCIIVFSLTALSVFSSYVARNNAPR